MKALLTTIALLLSSVALAHGGGGFTGAGLLNLLVYVVIIGLIFWCVWWFVGYAKVPEPFNRVILVVIGLIALVVVINLLLGLLGTPLFGGGHH